MSDIIYRLTKGTELTFGELDRNFGSLDSDMVAANVRIDNLQAASGIDSAQAQRIIDDMVDSAYVQLRQIDSLRDSAFITNIVDSQYVTDRVDLTQLNLIDSAKVMAIIDSHVDSDYIKFIADSDYIKSAANRDWIRLNADSDYVKSAADSNWIKFVADSNYVQSAADSDYIKLVVDSGYLTHVIDSDYVISITGIDSARVVQLMESDAQHILPAAPEAFDLGGNLRRWRAIYTKDLFVSPATIYFGDTSNPQQSRISLDSTGDFTLISPSSSGKIATSTTGTALDSNVILSMVDSAYVQARQIVGGSPWDSAKTTSVIDSAYIQSRQVDLDTQRDSAFVTDIVDAAYVQARVTFPTDQVGIDSAQAIALIDPRIINGLATIDSAYVQSRVTLDGVGIDSAVSIGLTQSTVDSAYVQARVTLDGVGISNVVEDTTPQLGGNLDVNSNNIQFGDSGKAQFGAGPDLEMYHDGANSFINDVGDGSIFIRSGTTYFQNAAGTKTSFQTNSGGAQKFFFNNDLKIETVDSGAKVTGNLTVTGEVKSVGPQMVAWGRHKAYDTFDWDSAGSTDVLHYGGVFAGGDTRPIFDTGIKRISSGRYRYYLDSTNMDRITNGNSYQVFCTLDYNDDDPTASSRTLNVLLQDSDYFDLVLERADAGTNEDYGVAHSFINFQVWLF